MRLFSPRPRARRAALLLGGCALAWLLTAAMRAQTLLAQGRAIEAHSARFARDYFVGAPDAPALTYLVMGDSTAAGWGAQSVTETYPYLVAQSVARRGFRVHVVNVAQGGATLRAVRQHQLGALRRARPDFITLSVGANDATHGTAPNQWKRELQSVASALANSGARAVLIANTPAMFLAPALPLPFAVVAGRRAHRQNQIFASVVGNTRLQTVDLYQRGQLDARRAPELYAADRFHPSAQGYAKWATLFVEALAKTEF